MLAGEMALAPGRITQGRFGCLDHLERYASGCIISWYGHASCNFNAVRIRCSNHMERYASGGIITW